MFRQNHFFMQRKIGLGPLIQRRQFIGPVFRAARNSITIAAGAVAGGAAYVEYKMAQVGSNASEQLHKLKDKASDLWGQFTSNVNQLESDVYSSQDITSGNNFGNEGQSQDSGSKGSNDGSGGAPEAAGVAIAVGSQGDDDDRMVLLTRKMIEIRNILVQVDQFNDVKLPSIAVIGSQSSGKSSVLEALVGHEFLPKGGNMVTRRPIELTLVNTPNAAAEYCEFPALKLGKITDFGIVRNKLTELNLAVAASDVVSEEPIQLTVCSPRVPDLTLIDLPGYIQVVGADQPLTLKARIEDLCEKYIQEPNVILAISAADVDLANSTALQASKRVDPAGERTIGVLTKMDLVSPERARELLENKQYPLKMGYVGVITRISQDAVQRVLRKGRSAHNLTDDVAIAESNYFDNITTFKTLNTGIMQLRETLMKVLEKSMSESLRPTTRSIQKELEECKYQLKVEYNDRVLTPQTYLAQTLDSFKISFQEMASHFGREQVKMLVKSRLDQKVLDILAEQYWNSPFEVDETAPVIRALSDFHEKKPDSMYWQRKLDQASSSLTKLGIGRLSSQLLVSSIQDQVTDMTIRTAFKNHPMAIETIEDATRSLLGSRIVITADQIENSIKPYKYEVDVDDREWKKSREHAYNLLKEELRQCQASFNAVKRLVGSSQLSKVMGYIEQQRRVGSFDHLHYSPALVDKGKEAIFLRDRCDILRLRMAAIKSNICRSRTNKWACPEVFLDVVADKLTATSVLFLNFELLSDYYYSFPRELDDRLGKLTETDLEVLASQDPKVKHHVELQRRKDLLQLALDKIQTVTELHESWKQERNWKAGV